MKTKRHWSRLTYVLVIGASMLLVASLGVAFAAFVLMVSAPVGVTATTRTVVEIPARITAASMASIACPIAADGFSATCATTNLIITTIVTTTLNGSTSSSVASGNFESLLFTVQNTGATTYSPILSATSSDPSVTISGVSTSPNPTSLPPGSTGVWTFIVTAQGANSLPALIKVTLSQ